MDSALLTTGITVVTTVALVFIGAWETARRNRQAEARKDAAAERASLEAQAIELVAAVLALRVAGDTHDHVWGGWGARGRVALRALVHGGIAYGLAGRTGGPALFAASGEAARAVFSWDQESGVSAGALAVPLARLGTAMAPLLLREDLAPAADGVLTAAVRHHGDNERMDAALRDFREALRQAVEPPAPVSRSRWTLRRR
ncbi:hypothetical protein OHB49_45355 (plasmid) [Streptomyces sp. NBC_01717]|uniref:hypothetical protein n=1 Tax=Streptomyces sp. NBC_01717 TaxID=2975918 RepID=UPI002E32F4AA|nr:hypothetical protein [Streptomyces sp. NBC_01717]